MEKIIRASYEQHALPIARLPVHGLLKAVGPMPPSLVCTTISMFFARSCSIILPLAPRGLGVSVHSPGCQKPIRAFVGQGHSIPLSLLAEMPRTVLCSLTLNLPCKPTRSSCTYARSTPTTAQLANATPPRQTSSHLSELTSRPDGLCQGTTSLADYTASPQGALTLPALSTKLCTATRGHRTLTEREES